MSVRAKFKCVNKIDGDGGSVDLEAVIGGSEENDSFFQYTPYGRISMGTVNAEAMAKFEIGKEYYVDFTAAE